jgi:hypothetical protein
LMAAAQESSADECGDRGLLALHPSGMK